MAFIKLIQDPSFISFISTFGLAVVLVLYFIFYRDPKQQKYFKVTHQKLLDDLGERYKGLATDVTTLKQCAETCTQYGKQIDELTTEYNELNDSYKNLLSTFIPEKREMSSEQTRALGNIGLDRDLFKLYTRVCRYLDNDEKRDVGVVIQETINDTNETWERFKTPFPDVPRITHLYGVYSNKGGKLQEALGKILSSDDTDEEKKEKVWNKLTKIVIDMKQELQGNLQKLNDNKQVEPFQHPV